MLRDGLGESVVCLILLTPSLILWICQGIEARGGRFELLVIIPFAVINVIF